MSPKPPGDDARRPRDGRDSGGARNARDSGGPRDKRDLRESSEARRERRRPGGPESPPDPVRNIAWRVLNRVELDRAFADRVLHALLAELDLPKRDRAFATELSYGALRMRGRLDSALQQVCTRELSSLEAGVRNLLRLGAYQVMFLERVRDAAAVDETVTLARANGLGRAAGFINAVLRELSSRGESLEFPKLATDPVDYLVEWCSLPRWLAERWLEQFGAEQAAELARNSYLPPPRTVRVSPGADLDQIARRLRGRRCEYSPQGITRIEIDPVSDSGFAAGEFSIQDEAAQLIALMVDAQPNQTVVDCCAAPGGKAVQLAQQVGPRGEVIALELHKHRLGLIRREAERLRLRNLRVLQRDVAKGFDLQGRLYFPRILVDAPCTGLGVLRRNPDARWSIMPGEIEPIAQRQFDLLDSVARYVEDDGALVYSVCTLTPEETTGVIDRFCESHPEFQIEDPRDRLPGTVRKLVDETGALRTLPHRHGCDGFYAVRLVRR